MRAFFSRAAGFTGVIFYALVLLFAGIYLSTLDWGQLLAIRPNWALLAVATVFGLVARFWFAGIWVFFLRRLGAKINRPDLFELFEVYAKSWLGRYIPGSVAWVMGKIYFASKLGISKTRLAISSFLEAILQIVVVLLTASLLLIFDPRSYEIAGQWIWLLAVAAILGLIAVWPPILARYSGWVYKRLRGVPIERSNIPSNSTLGLGIAAFAASSIISGLAFFFVAAAVDANLGWKELLFVLGVSNLASAVSMAAVFAPAGIGVREAVQLGALLLVMTPEQALLATVLMRLASIAWDAMFLGLAHLLKRFRGRPRG